MVIYDNVDILGSVTGFDWDLSNIDKNWKKHKVSVQEAESIFFNEPLVILSDEKHSSQEIRFAAFGKTDDNRKLAVVFTLRGNNIRVISARDMNRKEVNDVYEK